MDTAFLTRLLQYYKFHVQIDLEDDDSYTAYSEELQLLKKPEPRQRIPVVYDILSLGANASYHSDHSLSSLSPSATVFGYSSLKYSIGFLNPM